MTTTPQDHRRKAAAHRERGNARMAEVHERRARELEKLAELEAHTERLTLTVRRKRYSVRISDYGGGWTASAHGRDDVFPAAHVRNYASRAECLAALRSNLNARSITRCYVKP